MIRFDKSDTSVVITCDECGNLWAEIAPDVRAAARRSIQHELDVHNIHKGKTQGYGILYQSTRRATKT